MHQLGLPANRACVTLLLWLGLVPAVRGQSDTTRIFQIDSLPKWTIWMDKGWVFHAGDELAWSQPTLDDSHWEKINPTQDLHALPAVMATGRGWLRLRLAVGDLLQAAALAALVNQHCASEIYLNGKLLKRYGSLGLDGTPVRAYNPLRQIPLLLPFDQSPEQVLAVRFAVEAGVPYIRYLGNPTRLLSMEINSLESVADIQRQQELSAASRTYTKLGFFLLLAFIHLCFFRFYPAQRANLYFGLYAFIITLGYSGEALYNHYLHWVEWQMYTIGWIHTSILLPNALAIAAQYALFGYRRDVWFWLFTGLLVVCLPSMFLPINGLIEVSLAVIPILGVIITVRLVLAAMRQKKREARIIGWGSGVFILFYTAFWLGRPAHIDLFWLHVFFNVAMFSTPLSISVNLALEFAFTNQSLRQQMATVERLSAQTIAQEQEKQRLLAQQNETLEQKVAERTYQLQQSLDTLKTTQAQLIQKEKMASLGELTAGIAHEIQNPLNFVNNFAEVSVELAEELQASVQAGNPDGTVALVADLQANMACIAQNGQRASGIVRSMLEHARSSTGERQLTDLNALAGEYLKLAYHGFRAKSSDFQVQLTTDFDPDLPPMEMAAQDMGRVLLNLYNNAFYAVWQKQHQMHQTVAAGVQGEVETNYQPHVWVSTRWVKACVELRVKDNGVGIPESLRDKVFQPFFTTKPAGQGAGLGLSMSYDIITKGHSGEITVESVLGETTEFTVKLPVSKQQ